MIPSANQRILVIGATGMLGKPVAYQLNTDGFKVRILARSPEKATPLFGPDFEVYQGDVEEPSSLLRALEGCHGVHINLKGGPKAEDYDRLEHRAVVTILQAAQSVGIKQLTHLSSYTIQAKNTLSPESRAKFKAEEAIRASSVPYIIFRASWFMETLPQFIQGKRGIIVGKQPHPLHWIAAADYARMVSQSYQNPQALNKALYIYGPQAFTMKQALQTYCQLVAPQVQVMTMPIWVMRLLGKITFNVEWQSLAELFGYYDKVGEEGNPQEANNLLGTPQTTLQQWCETQRQ